MIETHTQQGIIDNPGMTTMDKISALMKNGKGTANMDQINAVLRGGHPTAVGESSIAPATTSTPNTQTPVESFVPQMGGSMDRTVSSITPEAQAANDRIAQMRAMRNVTGVRNGDGIVPTRIIPL